MIIIFYIIFILFIYFIHYTNLINISKTMQLLFSIRNIFQTIINGATQISQYMFFYNPMHMSRLNQELAQCVHNIADIRYDVH